MSEQRAVEFKGTVPPPKPMRPYQPPQPKPELTLPDRERPDFVIIYNESPRASRSPTVEDGVYRLKLIEVREEPNPFLAIDPNSAKTRFVWRFTVEGMEGELRYFSSVGCGPRLDAVLSALNVRKGDNPKASELIGRVCQGRVENVQTEKGEFPRIKGLFPLLNG